MRNYKNLVILDMIDENSFVGSIEQYSLYHSQIWKRACYGWSKGAGFFIYKIEAGHIEKLGSIKREELHDQLEGFNI